MILSVIELKNSSAMQANGSAVQSGVEGTDVTKLHMVASVCSHFRIGKTRWNCNFEPKRDQQVRKLNAELTGGCNMPSSNVRNNRFAARSQKYKLAICRKR